MDMEVKSKSPSLVEHHASLATRLIDGLERVIRGKRKVLEYLVAALLAEGHVLLEDVPGLGKTTLAKTVARLIARDRRRTPVNFRRIQFTPDLLPYDITGVEIFDPEARRFVFQRGPVFAQVLLADEINQVTVGNRTHAMDPLFFVVATQNPVETEGTYPLPLAQLDRFLMRLRIGYPEAEEELGIVRDDPAARIMPTIRPVCTKDELLETRDFAGRLYCDERLMRSAVAVVAATRHHRGIELGASPRASLMLVKAMRACALVRGRDYCIDQDLVELAPLVLSHRMRLKDPRLDLSSQLREMALHELERLSY
jgi:MoxR-like ATPase